MLRTKSPTKLKSFVLYSSPLWGGPEAHITMDPASMGCVSKHWWRRISIYVTGRLRAFW